MIRPFAAFIPNGDMGRYAESFSQALNSRSGCDIEIPAAADFSDEFQSGHTCAHFDILRPSNRKPGRVLVFHEQIWIRKTALYVFNVFQNNTMDETDSYRPLGLSRNDVLTMLSIGVVVISAYLPAIQGGFIWDDAAHVTRPDLRSLHGLWRIWFEVGATQQYYPLLHSMFWLEHRLWGDTAAGYHIANTLLHVLAASLLLVVLRRLKIPGAALAAAIFALHPVHVESVAWITEQKNTLSTVFCFSALLAYLRFDQKRQVHDYAIASTLFVMALLTKTVTATLPAALLVIFWWQRGDLSWRRDFRPLLPWFVAGAISGLFTAWVERDLIGAEGAPFELSHLQRTLLAGRVVWFYLGKLLLPVNLTFIYPRWVLNPGVWWHSLFSLGVLGAVATAWMLRRKSRAPLAVSLLFIGTLFPVLGFFNVFPFIFSFVADHFQYLASAGIISRPKISG